MFSCVICEAAETVGRKLCRRCYNAARKAGTLKKYPLIGPQDIFEQRIKRGPGCWLWTGAANHDGYGIILMPGEINVRAHRYSYEYFIGKIPKGKIILHTCDNPLCVNPGHLRVASRADNIRDASAKRRLNYGTDHWNGRLTEADVRAIRKSAAKQTVLAEKYGVTQSHISHIKAGHHRRVK